MALPRITSPHATGSNRTRRIMQQVLVATLPGLLTLTWLYGFAPLINLLLASATALGLEAAVLHLRQRPVGFFLNDCSALVTAMLLALALPPQSPWWLTLTACGFAILFGKHVYGGLGQNPFNPAMVGYVVALVSFPVEMTAWPVPHVVGLTEGIQHIFGIASLPDGWSQATALDALKTNRSLTMDELRVQNPAFGHLGSRGAEWVNLAFLAGGLFMLRRRLFGWHAPAGMLGALFVMSLLFWNGSDSDSNGSPPVSSAERCNHARRLLHRHRSGERRYQQPGATDFRNRRRHPRLCDPHLGRLPGWSGLRRAADEPGRTDHRLLQPPAHLWASQG